MKKLPLLMTALLIGVSGAWAQSKISKAVAGTYLFDSGNPALTVNKGGATITSSDGAIVIHHDDLSIVTSSRTYAAVVMRVDMPTTAPSSFSQFINLKTSSNNTASIGLGVTTEGKLKGTWQAGEYGPETSSAVTGEHTIVMLCNNSGTTIYVDDASTYVNHSRLKCSTKWTDLRIESAYVSCVKSVYVFSGDQASNIASFFSELSNVVTVANGETKSVSDNSTATRFFVASGGTLTADATYDLDKIEGAGDVTLDVDATISGNISTVATGKLTINEGKTLTLGESDSQTNSIESFTSIDLAGTIKHNNSKATLNNVTVPTGKTGKVFAYDMGADADGFKLAGTTTLNGDLTVCNKWNFQMKVDVLAGSGTLLICGTTSDDFNASGTASREKAIINVAAATTFIGTIDLNNVPTDNHPGTNTSQVTVQGNLVGCTLKKTTGDYFYYSGSNLNGTTLDGVILSGTERITTSDTVNIKNLAGNNLNDTNHLYAFVGSGTINFYGTSDLTKKSDGTDCNSANIGYGSSATIIIKAGANVTAGVVLNSSTLANNAPITVEESATLTTVGSTHADNGTLLIYSTNLTNNGTVNLNADGRNSNVSELSGSGTLNVASGSTISTPSVPSTMTLTGAGDVVLTSFPTSTAPTLNTWTGAVTLPDNPTTQASIDAILNAWGNEDSVIKLNNANGYFSDGATVTPTLNILSDKTLTINDGYSDRTTYPTLNKVTGAGTFAVTFQPSNEKVFKIDINTLTNFTGTLSGQYRPIYVKKLVLAEAPEANDLLIKTSGTVTLNTEDPDGLYVGLQRTSAYTWETKTVDEVEGIYVSTFDQVQQYRDMAAAVVTPYFSYIGTGVGKYTISLGANKYTTINDFTNAINAWTDNSDYVAPTVNINQPTSGFYRFKAAARSKSDNTKNWYMGANDDGIYSASTTESQASDANTIFYLEKDDYGYHPISYFSGRRSAGTSYDAIGSTSNFSLTQAIKENDTDELLGEYKIVNTGTSSTIVMWSNDHLNAINGNNDWSGWVIEEVTSLPVTITKYGMRTFSAPVALTIPEGVHAYTVSISGADVTLNEVETTIPANTPVVLYSHDVVWDGGNVTGDSESFDFPIASANTAAALDCELTATVAAQAKTDNDLTLQYDLDNKVFGFWKAAGTQINGFSAYLEWKESYSAVRRFVINTPNTGIGAVQEQQIGNGTYDLQGRRVEKVAKGLYIQNGKKVLF
ncbi:MAG: hypothetical protein IJ659_05950 [Alloprevotella sp.]|nr:hypothetical protein [Alloprevotella sp.]